MLDLAEPAAGLLAEPAVDVAAPDAPEPAAADAPEPASTLAARVAAYRRGQVVVDYANRGAPVPEIAARLGISEAEARKKLREALARALPESPEVFAALQMSRLNEALLVAYSAMGEMGLKAVDRVLRIVRALDRIHKAARPLAAAAAGDAVEPAAVAACAGKERVPRSQGGETPPLHGRAPSDGSRPDHPGGRKRNQTAPQTIEKAQNRSQTPEPPPAPAADFPFLEDADIIAALEHAVRQSDPVLLPVA